MFRSSASSSIALDPDRAVAYLNLADSLAALDRRDEAVEAYTTYIQMAPGSPVQRRIEGYLDEE